MEQEAIPELLTKLRIRLHLVGPSLQNTVSILELVGVERALSAVHDWVHKANLQPEDGRSPGHVAVGETVIQLTGQRYWLYATVDPKTNELHHTELESTTTTVLAPSFLATVREKHDVDDALFLVNGAPSLQTACSRHGLDFRHKKRGNRNGAERVFLGIKRRTSSFSNSFSHIEAETPDDWLGSLAFAWNQLI